MFSLGTLDWGENPRDAAMVDVAKELGYDLSGTTTVMTREKLMAADAIIVFDERHRDAITRRHRSVLTGHIGLGRESS